MRTLNDDDEEEGILGHLCHYLHHPPPDCEYLHAIFVSCVRSAWFRKESYAFLIFPSWRILALGAKRVMHTRSVTTRDINISAVANAWMRQKENGWGERPFLCNCLNPALIEMSCMPCSSLIMSKRCISTQAAVAVCRCFKFFQLLYLWLRTNKDYRLQLARWAAPCSCHLTLSFKRARPERMSDVSQRLWVMCKKIHIIARRSLDKFLRDGWVNKASCQHLADVYFCQKEMSDAIYLIWAKGPFNLAGRRLFSLHQRLWWSGQLSERPKGIAREIFIFTINFRRESKSFSRALQIPAVLFRGGIQLAWTGSPKPVVETTGGPAYQPWLYASDG